ncbi:hypothetical protein IWW48_004280 [Coemansia sp. RSA 1200]|nr:hypothetical protein IWW48_004280 [Coemansia sp. RSA 1200]
MKLNVPYVLASIAVFGTAAVGQDSDNTKLYGGMGGLPTPTPGNVYQAMQRPNVMMPGAMIGGGSMGGGAAPMPGAMAGGGGMGIPPVGAYGSGSREERMPSMVQALLGRIASYFDFSQVTSDLASTPTMLEMVYDPATRKFTYLAASVMQSGDVYYVPVCPVEGMASPTAAGTAGEETASPTDSTDTNTDTDTGPDTNTDAGANTSTDAGANTSTDAGANTSTDAALMLVPIPALMLAPIPALMLAPIPALAPATWLRRLLRAPTESASTRANMNILRTVFAIIRTLARPMFFFGESSSMRSTQ